MGLCLLFVLSFLIPCALQLAVLRLTRSRRRGLRWLLPLAAAALLVNAWRAYSSPSLFFCGLVALFYLILAGCVLLGWGAAWGVNALWNRKKGGSP